MARLIDADALEADLKKQYDEIFGKARKTVNPDDFFIERFSAFHTNVVEAEQKAFLEYLKARPTVEEAVIPVRCKDCQHYNGRMCEVHSEWPDQYSNGHDVYMEPDDFCSYGKRRDAE